MAKVSVKVLAERISSLQRELNIGLQNQSYQTRLALEASEKAVLKAENASEKRFESVNEFRATLQDQASHLITRTEVEALTISITADIKRIEENQNKSIGHGTGVSQFWSILVAFIGMLVGVIGTAVLLLNH